MLAGEYEVRTSKNAKFAERWSIAGISTTVGYSANMDIRLSEDDTGSALLQLDEADGLTLSTSGGSLHVDVYITEAQIDSIYTAIVAAGAESAYYSLKITPPGTGADQWLVGPFAVVATPTA